MPVRITLLLIQGHRAMQNPKLRLSLSCIFFQMINIKFGLLLECICVMNLMPL